MGITRMEEQQLTAELVSVKRWQKRKWRGGGEEREGREGRNESKRVEEFRDGGNMEERKYSTKGARRKMILVNL